MIPLLALLLLSACPSTSAEGPAPPPAPAISVATGEATVGSVSDPVQATGLVAPSLQATVSSEGSGRVLSVAAHLGDAVKEGQILARLDPAAPVARLAQAQANLRAAEARLRLGERALARADELLEEGATSDAAHQQSEVELDGAQAAVDGAQATVTLAERAVADARIRAPWSGRVAAVFLNEGALIGPGTPAFRLVSLDPVKIVVGLAARDVGRVRVGQVARVSSPSAPSWSGEGAVARVGPEADAQSRTFPVEIELPNPDLTLLSGMVARVDILVGERSGVTLVPEDAVLAGDPPVVYVLDDGHARRHEVTLGRREGGRVEIRGDVTPGDRVATLGRQNLSDGALVTRYDLPATTTEP